MNFLKYPLPFRHKLLTRKVLLVDDITDTGDTLEIALNHIKSFAPQAVRTAIPLHKKQSPIVPDFYAKKIIKNRWIIYPWAVTEDLSGFIAGMDNPPTTPEAAGHRILKEYGIAAPIKILKDIFTLHN